MAFTSASRLKFFFCDLFLFLAVLGLYLSRIIYHESGMEFWRNEVVHFEFNLSLFDIVLLTFIRFLILQLFVQKIPYAGVLVLFAISVLYVVIKASLYLFGTSGDALSYVVVIFSVVAASLEILCWKMVLAREHGSLPQTVTKKGGDPWKQPLLSSGGHNSARRYSGHQGHGAEAPRLQVNGDDEDSHSHYSESDFLSADEIADGDLEGRHDKPMSSRSGVNVPPLNFTAVEQDLIERLRESFPEFPEDKIHRFLIAKKFDYANTFHMLDLHREWRSRNDVDALPYDYCVFPIRGFSSFPDGIAEKAPSQYQAIFNHNGFSLHRIARSCQPVVIYPVGNADAKGSATNFTKEILENFAVQQAELLGKVIFPELEACTGTRVSSATAVLDLGLLGIRQFYVPALFLLTGMIKLFEDNYPESISVICIVNAPAIFQMFWNFIKPLLNERTLSKIRILGSNYREELLKLIAPENLPYFLGGLCNCRCELGCVPCTKAAGYEDPKMTKDKYWKQPIKSDQVFNLPVAITQDEINLRTKRGEPFSFNWTFRINSSKVQFGVFYLSRFDLEYDTAPDASAITPMKPHSAQNQVIEGTTEFSQAGLYLLRWKSDSNAELHYKLSEPTKQQRT